MSRSIAARCARALAAAAVAAGLAACANGNGVAPASNPADATPVASAAPLDRDQKTLLDATRQIAAKLLVQLGAFPPLAVALDTHGKALLVSNDVDPSLSTDRKIDLLLVKLKALAVRRVIRAAGIIVNGQIDAGGGKRQDAVLLSIEERGSAPLGFAVPYQFRNKKIAFAAPEPLRARPEVFAAGT